MSLVALALAFAVTGQAPAAQQPERVIIVGKVREVGGGAAGQPRALFEAEDKTEYELHGTNAGDDEELRRLAGVRVKILGVRNDPLHPRGNHVRVDRYEIMDVGGGLVPRIGRLAVLELDGKPRLIFVAEDGKAELLPVSWLKKGMEKHAGAKIWVAGNRSDVKGELTPARFAILRPGAKAFPDDARRDVVKDFGLEE